MTPHLKNFFGKVTLLLAATLFCLFVLEVAVRILDLAPTVILEDYSFQFVENPEMIYELKPGVEIDGERINAQGFRGRDFVEKKPNHTVRIVMLGDSITQGVLVPWEDTFSFQLEKILNDNAVKRQSVTRYEIMNFGVGGYNLGAEVEVLKTKALPYDPDIVVLNIFSNDCEPAPGIQHMFLSDYAGDDFQRSWKYRKYYLEGDGFLRWFQKHVLYRSQLYVFCVWKLNNIDLGKFGFKKYAQVYNSAVCGPKGESRFAYWLLQVKRLQESSGFKLLVCLHSNLLLGVHPNNAMFAREIAKLGIPYFHIFDYYQKAGVASETIKAEKEDTCHPNRLGHSIIAEAILKELEKNHLIDLGAV